MPRGSLIQLIASLSLCISPHIGLLNFVQDLPTKSSPPTA